MKNINRLQELIDSEEESKIIIEAEMEIVATLSQAIRKWIEFEEKQIEKEGPYAGKEINDLIKNGKESLALVDKITQKALETINTRKENE